MPILPKKLPSRSTNEGRNSGVIVANNVAYVHGWQRAFGELPVLVNPQACWPRDRRSVTTLCGAALEKFRAAFDEDFWRAVPAFPGALQACDILDRLVYELVCVTVVGWGSVARPGGRWAHPVTCGDGWAFTSIASRQIS